MKTKRYIGQDCENFSYSRLKSLFIFSYGHWEVTNDCVKSHYDTVNCLLKMIVVAQCKPELTSKGVDN